MPPGRILQNDVWMECFKECGLSISFYTSRIRELDEILPRDFIDCGVTKEYLKLEWKKSLQGQISPNCHIACQGCGAGRYGTGVCTKEKQQAKHEAALQEAAHED